MWVEILISQTLEQTKQIGQFAVLLRKDLFKFSFSSNFIVCSLLQGCGNATIKKPPGKAAFLLPSQGKHKHSMIKQKNRREAVFYYKDEFFRTSSKLHTCCELRVLE